MWEVYAYQNADSLFGVFNAAAAIHGAGDYRSALAAVAFCGFVAAAVAYAFAPEKLQGWKWLATVVVVFAVLILPRATVGIVDKTGGSPVNVVDNVPLGIAVLGSVPSTIGHTLTTLFETAFQLIPGPGALPAELAYQENGLMFGHRLIRETAGVVFQDPAFRTDLVNFIHNCTMYDLIDGTVDPGVFAAAPDVWALMATPNPARFSTVAGVDGAVTVATCPAVYTSLDGRLPAQLTRLQGRLAFQLNPTLPGPVAAAAIAGQIQQAYLRNGIANAAATAADLIRQNAVLNAIEDAGTLAGQKTADPAAMVLAVGRAQAMAQQNATWLNYGKVAEQALPVIRNVIEALTFALFPLFVLLLLVTSGRETVMAFKGYAAILIWIQLWPPLYAVLNYMAGVYAAYDLAAAADLGTGARALSLQTASTIYARAISGEAVVGYIAISIPFVAWAALKRMENFGTALVGGLAGLQGMLGSTTGSAATGNVSMGNVAMDQVHLAPNRTSAFMRSWQSDATGDTFSGSLLTGRTAASLLRNQGFASRVVSLRVGQQEITEASRQAEAARSELVAAGTERSVVLAEAFGKGVVRLHSSRSASGSTSSSFEQMGETLNRLDQITRGVSDSTGLSQTQVARIAFGAAAHLGLNTGAVGASVQGDASKSYLSGLSADQRKVLGAMTNEQLAEFKQFGDRVSRDSSFVRAVSDDERQSSELASRLATSTSRMARAQAAYGERTALTERLSAARERGEAIAIDIAQDPHNLEMFMRYAERHGGNSAAAHALLDAELARQALPPTPVFTDGTSVPTTFNDLQRVHASDTAAQGLNPDLSAAHRANRARIGGGPETMTPGSPDPAVSVPARDDIQRHGAEIRHRAQGAAQDFDSRAEIVRNPDGTVATRKSLLLQSGRQATNDASATLDDAKQVARDLLNKK
ncbi:conjugal transfer protein TraG N-terminal domain-containing protein [Azohydromonas australica]|uniref:conjugal transfer protein TraG N-terminal domain-containing protein n=1 Tax=Azohydromonas australica TaxID=364039 RepID=UPI00041824DE|nr:conjugal transfer protein TraG N-terminal domain-containing protein [Azohydromonas australica]